MTAAAAAAMSSHRLMADVHSMMWPRKFDYDSSCYPYHSHLTCSIGGFGYYDRTSMGDKVVSICGIT